MARITVEDCLKQIPNKFELAVVASYRVRELCSGATPVVKCKNREVVTALREIAAGYVNPDQVRELITSGFQSKRNIINDDPDDYASDEYERTVEKMIAEAGYETDVFNEMASEESQHADDEDDEYDVDDDDSHEAFENEGIDDVGDIESGYENEERKS